MRAFSALLRVKGEIDGQRYSPSIISRVHDSGRSFRMVCFASSTSFILVFVIPQKPPDLAARGLGACSGIYRLAASGEQQNFA